MSIAVVNFYTGTLSFREEPAPQEDRWRREPQRERSDAGDDSSTTTPWRPGQGGGGWRERQKAKEETWKKPRLVKPICNYYKCYCPRN